MLSEPYTGPSTELAESILRGIHYISALARSLQVSVVTCVDAAVAEADSLPAPGPAHARAAAASLDSQ